MVSGITDVSIIAYELALSNGKTIDIAVGSVYTFVHMLNSQLVKTTGKVVNINTTVDPLYIAVDTSTQTRSSSVTVRMSNIADILWVGNISGAEISSDQVIDDHERENYSRTGDSIKDHLDAINAALGDILDLINGQTEIN